MESPPFNHNAQANKIWARRVAGLDKNVAQIKVQRAAHVIMRSVPSLAAWGVTGALTLYFMVRPTWAGFWKRVTG